MEMRLVASKRMSKLRERSIDHGHDVDIAMKHRCLQVFGTEHFENLVNELLKPKLRGAASLARGGFKMFREQELSSESRMTEFLPDESPLRAYKAIIIYEFLVAAYLLSVFDEE